MLPDWNGASVVYDRASRIAEHLNRQAHAAQKIAARGKRFRFVPDGTAEAIIKAMGRGDEESLKAMNHQHRRVWQD